MNSQASRRVNERLKTYWHALRGDRPFPYEQEINPKELDDIWDSCFMVRLEADSDDPEFRYIYLGQSLVEAYGDDMNEKEVCERLAYPHNQELESQFMQVVKKQEPLTVESEFTNSKGLIIKYRSCMLPLAKEEPDEVEYVLGGMKWKAH